MSLLSTALVKKDQAQKRRIECSFPWGLNPSSDSQFSGLPALPSTPHPNRVLPGSSPDGLSDTLRSELVSQMESLFSSSPTGPASDGLPTVPVQHSSLSLYPEVSHGRSAGWCPCENLRCLAHMVPIQGGEAGGKLLARTAGSFVEPVGSRSLCAYAEAPETVQTIQRYRVLVMALLLPLPGYPLCRHRTFLTAKGTDGEIDPEEQDWARSTLSSEEAPGSHVSLNGVKLLIILG